MGGGTPPTRVNLLSTWQAWALALADSSLRSAVNEQINVASRTADKIGWEPIDGKTLHGGFRFCSGNHVVFIDYDQNEKPPAVPTDVVTVSSSTYTCGSGTVLATIDEFDFLQYALEEEPSSLTNRLPDKIVDVELSHSGSTCNAKFTFDSGSPSKLTASATLRGGSFGAITVS